MNPHLSKLLEIFVESAILAPSAHNSQPWNFYIKGNSIHVRVDCKRILSVSDKEHRELYLSVGCCIGNMIITAEEFDCITVVNYFPDKNDNELVAIFKVISFSKKFLNSTLKIPNKIRKRRTDRGYYLEKEIDKNILNKLHKKTDENTSVYIVQEKEQLRKVMDIMNDALGIAFNDRNFLYELANWLRPSYTNKRDGMPGYAMNIPYFASFFMPLLLRRFNIKDFVLKESEKFLKRSQAIIILASKNDNKDSWVDVGVLAERFFIRYTEAGLASQILNAAVEISNSNTELKKLLCIEGSPILMWRLGYSHKVIKPTPRRRYEECVIKMNN